MRKFAPFLKLYTEYVKNFDNALATMTLWMDKSTRFAAIIDEIQVIVFPRIFVTCVFVYFVPCDQVN
jgi:hypothetical protein